MLNHFEYDRETLKGEYDRDKAQGNDIDVPAYYFPNDDDTQKTNYELACTPQSVIHELDQYSVSRYTV